METILGRVAANLPRPSLVGAVIKPARARRNSHPANLLPNSTAESSTSSTSASSSGTPEAKPVTVKATRSSPLLRRRRTEDPKASDLEVSKEEHGSERTNLAKRLGFTIGAISIGKTAEPSDAGSFSAPLTLSPGRVVVGLARNFSFRTNDGQRESNLSESGITGSQGSQPITPVYSAHHSPISAKTPGSAGVGGGKTVGSRLSSLLRRESAGSVPSYAVEGNPQSLQLDAILSERENRNALVDRLLVAHNRNACLCVRFISGLNEALRSDGSRDTKSKAKKLVSLFLTQSSKYYIQGLNVPKETLAAVQQGSSEGLHNLKTLLLKELLSHEPVHVFLAELTSETPRLG